MATKRYTPFEGYDEDAPPTRHTGSKKEQDLDIMTQFHNPKSPNIKSDGGRMANYGDE